MREGFERVGPRKIGGTLPHDDYIEALHSIAISLKRIADAITPAPGQPVNLFDCVNEIAEHGR